MESKPAIHSDICPPCPITRSVHKVALSNTGHPACRDSVSLTRELQVSQRSRRSIRQPEHVFHLGDAMEVASTPTIHQHHNRHTTQPVIIAAR